MDPKSKGATALQKIARGYLAKKNFEKEYTEMKSEALKAGIVAPFVPTPKQAILTFSQEFLEPNDVLCDLGCGDGRVLLDCDSKILKGIGVEIQSEPLSKAIQASMGNNKFVWYQKDFQDDEVKRELQDSVTICFLFLLPEVLSKLAKFLVQNLRNGSRIICFTFSFEKLNELDFNPDFRWKPNRVVTIPDLPPGACMLYEFIIDENVKQSIII